MGLFGTIQDLLVSIFTGDPREAARRRELRRIYDDVRSIRPPCIKPNKRLILPGFATILFSFQQSLLPICELLQKTLNHEDPHIAERFRDYLLELRMPESEVERRYGFTYDEMVKRVNAAPSPDAELRTITTEFDQLMKSLDEPNVLSVEAELHQLDRLAEICRHDAERCLALFDPRVNVANSEYKPTFKPVEGDQVLPEILDLYYILADFQIELGIDRNLTLLLDRISPTGQSQSGKMARIVQRTARILRRQLTSQHLLSLIRLIKGDPHFVPKADREHRRYTAAYKKRLTTQFRKDRDRIVRERNEHALENDIKALFGDAELLHLDGYNDQENAALQEAGYATFTQIKPLRILKSFTLAKFERTIRDNLKRIIVEGFFENKQFQNNISNVYHQCDHTYERILAFEEELNGSGRHSVTLLRRYLHEKKRKSNVSEIVARIVEAVDKEAKELVEGETNRYFTLGSLMLDVVNDYKRRTPELISNIKAIGGQQNRELLASVASGYNDVVRLVRIMKHFTIIRSTNKSAAAAMDREAT